MSIAVSGCRVIDEEEEENRTEQTAPCPLIQDLHRYMLMTYAHDFLSSPIQSSVRGDTARPRGVRCSGRPSVP